MGIRGKLVVVAAAAVLVMSAAGCTSSTQTAKPTNTTTVTVPASPSPSPTSSSSGSPSASTAPSTPATTATVAECLTSHLTGSFGQGAGAAGTDTTPLTLTNHGSVACTIQGWPGVSYVTGENGAQVGAAAVLDRSTPHPTVTLAPGASAHATLTNDGTNAPDCHLQTVAGARVYPPGQKASLFIATAGAQECSSGSYLRVSAFN